MLGRWFTWVVLGAVIAVGVVAGVDALRSSDGEPPTAAAGRDRAVTTVEAETGAQLSPSGPVRLKPGRVATDAKFGPLVTFTVPHGWYLMQGVGGFTIGRQDSATLSEGGISVDRLDLSLTQAIRTLETTSGVRVKSVSPIRLGGIVGWEYALTEDSTVPLSGVLGLPINLGESERRVILLNVDGEGTLLIRRGFFYLPREVNRVLMSFEFLHG